MAKLFSFILLFLFLSLEAQNANPFLRGQQPPFPVLVVAHRGARAYAPENTLPAFEKAAKMGAHMFEMDVHLTKDGIPIVVHDDNLTRCSDVEQKFPDRSPFYVSDFTLEEIQKLDAGSWFVEALEQGAGYFAEITPEERKKFITAEDISYYKSGKVKHPTLAQALELAKEQNCFVNIEIKIIPRFYPGLTKKIVEVIEREKMVSKVVISSFDHHQLALTKKFNNQIATAVLCPERLYKPGDYCVKIVKADIYHPRYTSLIVGEHSVAYAKNVDLIEKSITNAHKRNILVNPWTINNPRHMEILLQAGIDGIISDYPNRALEIVSKMELPDCECQCQRCVK